MTMRTAPTYANVDEDGNIPLKSREHFKFYEPLILLRALNDELKGSADYVSAAEPCDVKDPRQLFQAYLDKLALVCDSTKGDYGAKVTAVWVSEDTPGQVCYSFTSNQRDPSEEQEMVTFMTALLDQIGTTSPTHPPGSTAIWSILSSILQFNRPRVEIYLESLRSEARRCLEQCHDLDDGNASIYKLDLKGLLRCCTFEHEVEVYSPSEYVRECQTVIRNLIIFFNSPTGSYVETRGREARESGPGDCWSELRHMMSRLLAYRQAVSFFLRARAQWPQLFDAFSVTSLPSSKAGVRYPVRNKSLTADSIVGRLTRETKKITLFKEFAEKLRPYQLDERIKLEFTRDGFHPLVHAEVKMLNHIEFSGGVVPARFFKGWMYIGSSKPTCKLCHYYFLEHGTHVGHRSSHGNLYTNWRFPDVRSVQGEAALKKRAEMLEKLLRRVRTDAFTLLSGRTATHRSHDSATSSARMTLEDKWSVASPADDLASIVGQLEIDDSDGEDLVEGGVKLG